MPTQQNIQVTDGRAAPPVELRRLFHLERSFDPVLVSASAPVRRVILHLPDNGAHRDRGPGVYRSGNVTKAIHADGCNFPVSRCRGECTTPREVAP